MRRFVSAFTLLMASLSADAGGFSGKVIDVVTHTGIPAVSVSVRSAGGEKLLGKAQTDANGAYTVGDLPNGGRVQLYCVRDGFQARPTIVLVNLSGEVRNPGDVRMISEQIDASYLRRFAAQFAAADEETQKNMRSLWFHLPKTNSDMISQEYATLTGKPPSSQHQLYVAEAKREREMLEVFATLESSDIRQYAQVQPTRMQKD